MSLRVGIAVLVGAGLLWVGFRMLSGPTPPSGVAIVPPPPAAVVAARKDVAIDAERERAAADPALPRGLRGTHPSGGLSVDVDGHFVPGPEALLFFEYWLSASNELPVPALTERIQAAIGERLSPPADAEAEAFLADYLDYLDAGDRGFAGPGVADSADLERRFQWVRELRREHFGPELAERLFADDEAAALLHLERRRIRNDPSLDPAERGDRLAALEAEYPDAVREGRARATEPLRSAREERMLRAAGIGEAEIDRMREDRFGPEAADRMRALDEQRAAWALRVERYRLERDALLADTADLADRAEGEAELERLRAEHFTQDERHRIAILDRAEAAGAVASPATP